MISTILTIITINLFTCFVYFVENMLIFNSNYVHSNIPKYRQTTQNTESKVGKYHKRRDIY